MRWLLAVVCLSFVTLSQASVAETLNGKVIEKVLVLKSAHQLQLINDGKPLKTYRISLGRNPKGQKLMEGDRRTPEGFYWLDWRKVSDKFNLSMHISYPNISDAVRARREGVDPGAAPARQPEQPVAVHRRAVEPVPAIGKWNRNY